MMLQSGGRPVPECPDYVLIRKLGVGAFGEVWHARGPGNFDVALKFIPNVRAHDLRSLDAVRNVRHPNLVSVFGVWYHDGCLILAMEKCDRSLQDRLTEVRGQNLTGIPPMELLSYMTDAGNGLDAMNSQNVQHRDVKPANLLLLNDGLKVADFGLAKALEQTVASNSGAGTLACFKGQLTQQSDQYSLAVTYYHLRTGRLLFHGNQAQVTYAHLDMAPDLSGLPSAEASVLARALSKQPSKRWLNCREFAKNLFNAHQPMCQAPFKAKAVIFYNRGQDFYSKSEFENAIREFSQAIQSDRDFPDIFVFRGICWRQRMESDKAMRDFDDAIRLNPTETFGYVCRGTLLLEKKAYEMAITDFDEAIRYFPNEANSYIFRGIASVGKNNLDIAKENFAEAIRRDLGVSKTIFNLATGGALSLQAGYGTIGELIEGKAGPELQAATIGAVTFSVMAMLNRPDTARNDFFKPILNFLMETLTIREREIIKVRYNPRDS